jgi:hypothetical protein
MIDDVMRSDCECKKEYWFKGEILFKREYINYYNILDKILEAGVEYDLAEVDAKLEEYRKAKGLKQ